MTETYADRISFTSDFVVLKWVLCKTNSDTFSPTNTPQGALISHLSVHKAHAKSLLSSFSAFSSMGAFTSSSNPFSSLASRPELLWYPFRCFSSSFCLYFVFSCSSSPLMNSSKQMIFKLCLFQETHSFIWRVYKKNLLHWWGTYITINAHLAGALILRNAARRMRGRVCYCLQGCPIFLT